MMKLGKLHARILIDEGFRPHYGPGDTVTGRLILSYKPSTSLFKRNTETADLFGPLLINVVLVGQTRTKIRRDRDMPTYHGVNLFAQAFPVYDGSFKAQVDNEYTFPFSVNFPQDALGIDFNGSTKDALPPTFAHHFSDYPDIVDTAVIYQLGAKVAMPGIDIKATVPEGDSAPQVKYDLPRPPISYIESHRSIFAHRAQVQNEYLLPEAERPQGFKQKAKAVFTSSHFPTFAVDISCTDQRNIYPGQQLNFEIFIRRFDQGSSASFFPETTLESFKTDLVAYTSVESSSRIIGSGQCNDRRNVQSLACRNTFPIEFHKANDWTTTISTDPVLRHTTSFEHHKISRVYQLRIAMQFKVATKSVRVVRECAVVIVPPPTDLGDQVKMVETLPMEAGLAQPQTEAGPSGTYDEDDAPPPTYEEAGSSKLLKSSS